MKTKHFFRRRPAALVSMLILTLTLNARAVPAGYTVFHGDRTKPDIAITVDDCYDSEHVAEILTLCEQNGVPVTFFVVGKALRLADGEIWRRALALGCEIGNHTWSHSRLPRLSRGKIEQTLAKTQEKLEKLLGHSYEMRMMRPPYGSLSDDPKKKSDLWVVETIERAGYAHAVRWDVSQTDPDKAIQAVENGSILLYHANPKDIRCLKKLIPSLLKQGYRCVTVSELLGLPAPVSGATQAPQSRLNRSRV